MKEGRISRSQAAQLLGVSPQTVSNWHRAGRLVDVETDEFGRLELDREEVLTMVHAARPPVERDGVIDPVALYEEIGRRVPNSLDFVRTLVKHGCDRNGAISCCDEIYRSVARDHWEAMVRGWKASFRSALAELVDNWTYRTMTEAQMEECWSHMKPLVEFVQTVEFGPEAAGLHWDDGRMTFDAYPVRK